MQDIRQWQMMFAILVAATIHTLAITLYMALTNPVDIEKILPPIILLRSPPPPPAEIPPQVSPQAPETPITAPAADPALPTVSLWEPVEEPAPVEPEPTPLDLSQFEVPVIEPVPEVKPEPEPVTLDLTQFEVPVTDPVPVPERKPPPPQVAETPAPPAPAPAPSAPSAPAQRTAPAPTAQTAVRWPERVEQLTTAQAQQLLTEFFVDDKSNWEPWYASRDDAWRRLNMGFIDPSAKQDYIILDDNPASIPLGVDEHEGPLTTQEVEETLAKLVAAGTRRFIGRDARSVLSLSYAERTAILEAHYADDPRWGIGIIDPTAPPDHIDLGDPAYQAVRPLDWTREQPPLTLQELNMTLARLVKWGTTPIIGRDVSSVGELTDPERQAILKNYYGDNPSWAIGIVDPTAPPDYIDMGDPSHQHLRPAGWDREESPYTVQERDEALRKMLEKKLTEQKARDAGQPAPAPTPAR